MSRTLPPATLAPGEAGIAGWLRPTRLPTLVTVLVSGAVCAASAVHPHPAVHDAALFVHLACLVVGFGAVMAVDWVALLWSRRLRTFDDVLAAARNAHTPIWIGYAGLVASGVFLEPDVDSPATRIKLALVLVIGWNGALAVAIHRHLENDGGRSPRGLVMVVSSVAAVLSQVSWWGATAVGFVNAH